MSNDSSATPILVNPTPGPAQIETALRDGVKILGAVLTMVGMAGWAGQLNGLLVIVGPAATVIAFIWSQLKTRTNANALATMAPLVSNQVAILKPPA